MTMYKYTECGLKNVYLVNGFHERKTPYGKAVSIDNVEGLHRVIGLHLADNKPNLTGAEFRFLRANFPTACGWSCVLIPVRAK